MEPLKAGTKGELTNASLAAALGQARQASPHAKSVELTQKQWEESGISDLRDANWIVVSSGTCFKPEEHPYKEEVRQHTSLCPVLL